MMKTWMGVLGTLLILSPASAALAQQREAELAEKVEVLADELARLREQLAIPETDEELIGAYGMGPAASKVYGANEGLSIGGYGEFYFAAPVEQTEETGATNSADFYRFITYFGYKFSPNIVMNTEIEFEHGGEEISVEFAYLDFLLDEAFNLRTGNLLVPMGFVNEMHEPAFYKGNFRPETERRIIPSTWREMGLGAHGTLGERVRYTAYVLNGLDASGFGDRGVRGGRQSGKQATWEDVGAVIAATYDHEGRAQLGGSFYAGQADQNALMASDGGPLEVSNWIVEAHGAVDLRGFEFRGLVAMSHIGEAAELTGLIYPDTMAPADPETRLVPEDQLGWYVEAAYDVAPYLLERGTSWRIAPWLRYEDLALQDGVPAVAGRSANSTLNTQSLTVGVDVKPHPNVVLKLDYVNVRNDADAPTSDEVRLGAGFVY